MTEIFPRRGRWQNAPVSPKTNLSPNSLLTLSPTARTFPPRSSRQRLLSPVGRISLTKQESARSSPYPKYLFPTSWRVTISGSQLNVSRAFPHQNAKSLQASQQRKSPRLRNRAMIPAPARLRSVFFQKTRSDTPRHEACGRSNRLRKAAVSAKSAQFPATAFSTWHEPSSDRPVHFFQIFATSLQTGPPTNPIYE